MVKDLESVFKSAKIVKKCGMKSGDPEYYSKNVAEYEEFNSNVLSKIYFQIYFKIGDNASKNYIRMVKDVKEFSALNFLINLYKLEAQNWKWKKRDYINKNRLAKEDQTNALEVISEMVSREENHERSILIKEKFLRMHRRKIPKIKKSLGPFIISKQK
jgi:RNA polymerase-interacting CarD/CdnL/TRCF family regulator